MKRHLLALCALSLVLIVTGCDSDPVGDDDDDIDVFTADLRAVHAAPGAGSVDVFVNDEEAFGSVDFSSPDASVTGFVEVPSDDAITIEVRPEGGGDAVISVTSELNEDDAITLIAAGNPTLTDGEIRGISIEEDLDDPAAGNFKVRLVHGASIAPAVDIYVTAPEGELTADALVAEDVAFGDYTDYLTTLAGDYQVRITAAEADDDDAVEDDEVLIDTGSLTFADGGTYTAIAVDPAADGEAPGVIMFQEDSE